MRTPVKVVSAILIAVLLLLAGGFGGWLLRNQQAAADATPASQAQQIAVGVPTIVSTATLKEFAKTHYPLYWAGTRADTQLEVTLTLDNGAYIRYLPKGAKAGDSAKYLTVGTYQSLTGYTGLQAADTKLAKVEHSKSGAVIVVFDDRPLSTYFSFPDAAFQVEVYSPNADESKALTESGAITPVGGEKQ